MHGGLEPQSWGLAPPTLPSPQGGLCLLPHNPQWLLPPFCRWRGPAGSVRRVRVGVHVVEHLRVGTWWEPSPS